MASNWRSPMPAPPSPSELVRPDAVHRTVYTDTAIFDAELERIFGQVWFYVGHASEIPEPNDFVTRDIARRPMLMTRSRKGEIHVLLNRCRHRGATVCRRESGKASRFTCPYHGWSYANSGELNGVPWPEAYGPDFDKTQLPLHGARVEIRHGFVFACLNPSAPSLSEYLGAAEEILEMWVSRFPGSDLVARNGKHKMVVPANWKLVLDNSVDGYHPAFSHRSLLQMASRYGDGRDMSYFADSPDNGPLYIQSLGHGHSLCDQRPAYDGAGSYFAQQRPAPGREFIESEAKKNLGEGAVNALDLSVGAQMNFTIFPNLLLIGNQIQVLDPISVDQTVLTWFATTSPELPDSINTLRMRHQEDFPAFGEPDDLANFAECQRGLAIPEVEWVMTNRGLGDMDRVTIEGEVTTGPVTHEHPARGHFAFWRDLMEGLWLK
ncbi:aromatic ring-hydroxylating oxygenase subunit alpha [Nocardia sp. CA-135953]|uniref:aromatic ring-hydroxylating oxygenase subunit alpha n=1 Tax=Nocardia sp. CA-135953 TaxID=3239978 RepID=UPI003D990455